MSTYTRRRSLRHPLATAALLVVVALGGLQGAASAAVQPTLLNQASPSGYPAGIGIYDAATLYYGDNPTGTITFKLYPPEDPNCVGAPVYTGSVPVNGNARYTSQYVRTEVVGVYRWITSYSGDARNLGTAPSPCSDPDAATTTGKRRPTIAVSAGPVAGDGSISVTSTLGSGAGYDGPTGRLDLRLYGPDNNTCGGTPTYLSTQSASGEGTYSASFTPTSPGTYRWQAMYYGDANNFGNGTMCTDSNGDVVVTGPTTTTTPTTVPPTTTTTVAPTTTTTVAPTPTTNPSLLPSIGVNPSSAPDGTSVSVSWSGIPVPTLADWIAIYPVGGANWQTVAWHYTNGLSIGSGNLLIPGGTQPGSYEVRFYPNNSYVKLASIPLTIT